MDWNSCPGHRSWSAGPSYVRLYGEQETLEARDHSGQHRQGRGYTAGGAELEEPCHGDRREYSGRATNLSAAMRPVPRGRRPRGDEAQPLHVPASHGFELTSRAAMDRRRAFLDHSERGPAHGHAAWKTIVSERDTWKVVNFIHALPKLAPILSTQQKRAEAAKSQAELVAYGRKLYRQEGCWGCHQLDGEGGTVGPDLTVEGAWAQ